MFKTLPDLPLQEQPLEQLSDLDELMDSIVKHMPAEPAMLKLQALCYVQNATLAFLRGQRHYAQAEEQCMTYLAHYEKMPIDPRP